MASDHRVSATKVVKYIKADTHVHYGYKALQQAILKDLKNSVSRPLAQNVASIER